MSTSNDDDIPEPEIEIIRNLVGGGWERVVSGGAFIRLDGPGVHENAVEVPVIGRVLNHFDRLFRIVVAHRGGLEVKRRGRITEVKGTRHLAAVAPLPGSFVIPLRLDNPEGELVVADHRELETVVHLLETRTDRIDEALRELPERAGDELVELLGATEGGQVDMRVVALRDGDVSARADVPTGEARAVSRHLSSTKWSETGQQALTGVLFRIDTRNEKIALDVYDEESEASEIVEASFSIDLLETLRPALHGYVEVVVDVREERRPYERTARGRSMSVVSVTYEP